MENVYSWLAHKVKVYKNALKTLKKPTALCLLCLHPKTSNQGILADYFTNDDLCLKCRNKFVVIDEEIELNNFIVHGLMLYDDFFKEVIIQYKECYDEVLSEVFLNNFKTKLIKKYHNALFIPAPSSFNKIQERGFNHVEQLYNSLGIEIRSCFEKSSNEKQALRSKKERSKINTEIKLIKVPPQNRSVVLIDDVCTTGNTLKAMVDLLKEVNIDCTALVLAVHPLLMKNKKKSYFDKLLHSLKAILNK